MFNLSGKIALVTGASRGIGRGIAKRLHDQGATVIAAARGDHAREVVEELTAEGGAAEAVSLDVTDAAALEKLPGELVSRYGRLDIVVSNAGIARSCSRRPPCGRC
jgi:3-oxoacyl-[acyl-carrier protein] reductase